MENGKVVITSWDLSEIKRWDEYAPKFSDNTAAHSAKLAQIAVLLCLVEERLFNNQIDKLKVVCGGLFHDFDERYTGSIKHSTKKDSLVEQDIREVEKDYKEKIVSYFSEALQPIFRKFIFSEDDTYEGKLLIAIDTLEAMLFCYRETLHSTSPFFKEKFQEMYEVLKNCEIPSIKWVIEEFDKKGGVYDFLMDICDLDKIKRWGGKRNTIYDDDSIHTFRTSVLVVFNAYLEKIKFKNKKEIDIFKLVSRMLFHDLPERKGGDVKGPLKHSTLERKLRFEEHEKRNALQMIEGLPLFLKDDFVDFMINAKANDFEGTMVDIADKTDALIKCLYELDNNSKKYKETYKTILNKIQKKYYYEHEHVKFFLSLILHDLIWESEEI